MGMCISGSPLSYPVYGIADVPTTLPSNDISTGTPTTKGQTPILTNLPNLLLILKYKSLQGTSLPNLLKPHTPSMKGVREP
jgi:hypothetical protein